LCAGQAISVRVVGMARLGAIMMSPTPGSGETHYATATRLALRASLFFSDRIRCDLALLFLALKDVELVFGVRRHVQSPAKAGVEMDDDIRSRDLGGEAIVALGMG
jgi:hypothetical protein